MPANPTPPTPWKPTDLPTLRAAYSDRTAALMAYLAAFAYDKQIEAKGALDVPQELANIGFSKLTLFSQRHDRRLGLYRGRIGPHRARVSGDVLRFIGLDRQGIDCAFQRIDLFVKRVDHF